MIGLVWSTAHTDNSHYEYMNVIGMSGPQAIISQWSSPCFTCYILSTSSCSMLSEPWRNLNGTGKCVKQHKKVLKGQTMSVCVIYRTFMCVRDPGFYSVASGTRTGTPNRGHILCVGPGGQTNRDYLWCERKTEGNWEERERRERKPENWLNRKKS